MEYLNENIRPLYFAAPIGWYADIVKTGITRIGEEQNFERQTLRNRIIYGTFQGARVFSIPLIAASTKETYQKVAINYHEHWQNQLINALQTAYGKSPFFEYYGYRFENIIRQNYEHLWDLNKAILYETFNCLKIGIHIEVLNSDRIRQHVPEMDIHYYQVFQEKIPFIPNLSILDLLYNEGPDAYGILTEKI